MADIDLQRRKANPLSIIIVLLLLGIFVWAVVDLFDDDGEELTVDVEGIGTLVPPPIPPFELIPVAVIVSAPESFAGEQVAGKAEVAEVISDRGFWLKDQGQRVFVVIDEPVPEAIQINAGQTLDLKATVYTPEMLNELPGTLESETRSVIENEPVFLYAPANDIRITRQAPTLTIQSERS